uniref:Uncharacterized protein n=1 Tax=Siphoviridae sp. ctMM521 TaxID=2826259 RepID=A0A8S5ML10_9CAUD|nr:MAG TPA: hypothetical protein [Siphoviridae sp. ctMM521]
MTFSKSKIIYLTIKSTRVYLIETYPTQNFFQVVTSG